jgi:DNA repair protein RecO (recombination protein O)
MPKILRTKAISLHSIPFAESSKVVTFFTCDFGKLNFLAKGARRPKSKFGGALETFTYASLILYKPETPKLYILSDAEIIRSFSELHTSTELYLAGSQIVEFVLRTVDFEEANARLFNLVLSALKILSNTDSIKKLTDNLVLAFLLKGASFLGFRPELDNCVACRKPLPKLNRENMNKLLQAKLFFDITKGGILCTRCKAKSTEGLLLIYNQLAYLKSLLYLPLKKTLYLNPPESGLIDEGSIRQSEMKTLISQYLKHHFEKLDLSFFTSNRISKIPKAIN